jgi:hypothetical protein
MSDMSAQKWPKKKRAQILKNDEIKYIILKIGVG